MVATHACCSARPVQAAARAQRRSRYLPQKRSPVRPKCNAEQRAPGPAAEPAEPSTPELQPSTPPDPLPRVPTLLNGVNWYCYTVLGLLFLVDFTPLGQLIQSQSSSGAWLCLLQWALCVVPTVWYSNAQGWDPVQTFKLRPISVKWLSIGSAGGVLVWVSVAAAVSLKTGVALTQPPDLTGSTPSLMAQLYGLPSTPSAWASLFASAAISPAVAEELLFRGFLLTSLQQRFGRIDAFMVAAAMFAGIHLSVEQFFPLCVLGIACGAVATASESVLPAIALHATHNAAALVAGVLLRGS